MSRQSGVTVDHPYREVLSCRCQRVAYGEGEWEETREGPITVGDRGCSHVTHPFMRSGVVPYLNLQMGGV